MIVQDKSVQNGMFSKAGRLTIEMYTLLQEKNQILTGQRGPQSQGFLPNFYYNRTPQNNYQNSVHRTLKSENQKHEKLPIQKQPFTKIVSRDQIQKVNSQPNISKLGVYTPKYHLIYEKSPLYQDQEFEQLQKQNVVDQRKKAFAEFQVKSHKKKRYNLSQNQSMISQQNTMLLPEQLNKQGTLANNDSILQSKKYQSQILNNGNQVLQHNNLSNLQQNQSIIMENNNNNQIKSPFFKNQDSLQQQQNDNHNQSILNRRGINSNNQSISNLHEGSKKYLGIDFDKPHKKIVGPVSYDRQSQNKFNSLNR